jgi:hypothetical protein
MKGVRNATFAFQSLCLPKYPHKFRDCNREEGCENVSVAIYFLQTHVNISNTEKHRDRAGTYNNTFAQSHSSCQSHD